MERSSLIDVCKGIGIVSIVIGHASWMVSVGNIDIPAGPFVYLYHLAIFFFCSGYIYKECELGLYVIKRIKSLYIPFVGYSVLYLIFRSLFIDMGILAGTKFSVGENIIALTNALTFNGIGEFLSAFWFLPVMFITMCLYAVIYLAVKRFPAPFSDVLRFVICFFVGCIGLYTTENGFGLLYNMQIAYLMVFVVEIGCLYKRYEGKLTKFINVVSLVLSMVILGWILKLDIGIIELSRFMIINKWVFYPVTLVGIWFCLSLSKLILAGERIKKVVAYIGKNSFDIMALHFLGFKIIDFVACHLTGQYENMSAFPHTYNNLWLVYIIVGVAFPLGVKWLYLILKENVMLRK